MPHKQSNQPSHFITIPKQSIAALHRFHRQKIFSTPPLPSLKCRVIVKAGSYTICRVGCPVNRLFSVWEWTYGAGKQS